MLLRGGGLVLPKPLQNDLRAVLEVLHVDDQRAMLEFFHVDELHWNPIQNRLVFTNLTVRLPRAPMWSLRTERLSFSWESCIKPSVHMEIDGIDILLEFTNLLMMRTNW